VDKSPSYHEGLMSHGSGDAWVVSNSFSCSSGSVSAERAQNMSEKEKGRQPMKLSDGV